MANIPEITISILGDASGFASTVKTIENGIARIENRVGSMASNLSRAFGGFLALPAPQVAATAAAVTSLGTAQARLTSGREIIPASTVSNLNAVVAKVRELAGLTSGGGGRLLLGNGGAAPLAMRNTPLLGGGSGQTGGRTVDVDAQFVRNAPAATASLTRIQQILSQVGSTAQTMATRIGGVFSSVSGAAGGIGGRLGGLIAGLRSLPPPGTAPGMQQVAAGTTAAGNAAQSATPKFGNMWTTMLKITAAAAALHLAWTTVKTGFADAAELEQSQTAFEVFLGSVTDAKKMVSELQDLDAKSPLNLSDLSKAASTMLSFGVSARQVVPSLKQLSDVSGGNADRFGSLALAFSQTASAGKLMGQDLLQYINAGFNPLQVISKKTGKSMADLRKEVEAGTISFDMVSDAFLTATSAGGMFFGFTEKNGNTWNGLIGRLSASIRGLFRDFSTPIQDTLKPMLSGLLEFVESIRPMIKTMAQGAATAIQTAVAMFKDGTIGQFIELSLLSASGKAINYLLGGLVTATSIAGEVLLGFIQQATDPQHWKAILQMWAGVPLIISGIAMILGAKLIEGAGGFVAFLAAGMESATTGVYFGLLNAASAFKIMLLDAVAALLDRLNVVSKKLGIDVSGASAKARADSEQEKRDVQSRKAVQGSENFTDLFNKYKANAPIDTKAMEAGGKDSVSKGLGLASASVSNDMQAVKRNIIDPALEAAKGFKPSNTIDTSGFDAKLGDLVKRHTPPPKPETPNDSKMGQDTTPATKSNKALVAIGDDLTAVGGGGGFAGADFDGLEDQATQQTDLQTQIAQNTAALVSGKTPSISTPVGTTPLVSNSSLGPAGILSTGGLTTGGLRTGGIRTAGLNTGALGPATTPLLTPEAAGKTPLINATGAPDSGVLAVLGDIRTLLTTIATNTAGGGKAGGLIIQRA